MDYGKKKIYQVTLYFSALLIAITSLFYLFILDYHKQIDNTKQELKGIDIIWNLQDIVINIQEIRGLENIYEIEKNSRIRDEIDKNIKKIESKIEYLKSKSTFDKECEKHAESFFRIKAKKDISASEKFEKYSSLVDALNKKIYKTKITHGLSLDPDHDTYHLITIMTDYAADMVEAVAHTRGVISGRLYTVEEADRFLDSIDNNKFMFKNASKKIKDIIENLRYHNEQYALSSYMEGIDKKYIDYADLTEKIVNSHLYIKPYEYFSIGTELIEKIHDFYIKNSEFLDSRLENKYKELHNTAVYGTISAVVSVFLLIIIWIFMIINIKKFFENEKIANEELVFANNLKMSLVKSQDVHEVCTQTLSHLAQRYGAVQGVIYLYKKANTKFYLGKAYSVSVANVDTVLEFDDGLIGRAAAEQREIYTDISGDMEQSIGVGIKRLNPNTIYTAPLFVKNKLIAVIQMVFLDSVSRIKDKEVGKYSDIIAGFINNEQIKEANEKYISLIDDNIIISTSNEAGEITDVSRAFENISQYKKEEIVGKMCSFIMHPDASEESYGDIIKEIYKNGTWRGEIRNRMKNGDFFWVDATICQDKDLYGSIIGHTMIQNDITDKKKLEEISTVDALTGLYNRRFFNEVFQNQYNLIKRDKKNMAFLIIDVDNFKEYNDTYGHQEGDEALTGVAQVLKNSMKRAGDYVFRLGGEEFGVLYFSDCLEDAKDIAEKLRSEVEALKIEHLKSSASERLTISSGLIFIKHDCGLTTKEIYKAADDALYRAKNSGKNRVKLHDEKRAEHA